MQNRYFSQNNDRNEAMVSRLSYPEIYYKIQPFVMTMCDQMDSIGETILDQDVFDQISDQIFAVARNMYPELIEYARCDDMRSSVEILQRDYDRDRDRDWDHDRDRDWDHDRDRDRDHDRDRDRRDRFPFPFRRRGIFRDFIDLLLLNELFRRGRIIY